jgi:hypothetical protein
VCTLGQCTSHRILLFIRSSYDVCAYAKPDPDLSSVIYIYLKISGVGKIEMIWIWWWWNGVKEVESVWSSRKAFLMDFDRNCVSSPS